MAEGALGLLIGVGLLTGLAGLLRLALVSRLARGNVGLLLGGVLGCGSLRARRWNLRLGLDGNGLSFGGCRHARLLGGGGGCRSRGGRGLLGRLLCGVAFWGSGSRRIRGRSRVCRDRRRCGHFRLGGLLRLRRGRSGRLLGFRRSRGYRLLRRLTLRHASLGGILLPRPALPEVSGSALLDALLSALILHVLLIFLLSLLEGCHFLRLFFVGAPRVRISPPRSVGVLFARGAVQVVPRRKHRGLGRRLRLLLLISIVLNRRVRRRFHLGFGRGSTIYLRLFLLFVILVWGHGPSFNRVNVLFIL